MPEQLAWGDATTDGKGRQTSVAHRPLRLPGPSLETTEAQETTMRPTRFALLLLAGVGLSGCVPVNDGYYGAPYGAYTGDRRLVTPYVYRGGSDGYLYNQSRQTWQGNYYRQSPNRDYRQYQDRDQNQGNYRNRYNRPTHDNRQND